MPLFQMGFKDINFNSKGIECLKREIAVKILLDMVMGRSSELYNRLYNDGLINNTFGFDYSIEESYAYSAFGGESKEPFKVKERVVEEIGSIRNKGLDQNSYERIKRAMNGRFIRQLNSIERISHMFISVYFKDVNMFDYFNVYENMSFDYVKTVFDEYFNLDNLALSVINPV
jgi:predicted Zn-dependent peptidase